MQQKLVFITGATSGIGKETALALAKQGAHVVLHGRDAHKAADAQREIIAACGHRRVDVLLADLSSLAQVRQLAAAFTAKYDRLDVLINNAGLVGGQQREVTAEGMEQTLAVNLLAPFLLMGLLLELLRKSPQGRIINVSSSAHRENAKPDFTDFQSAKHYTPLRAYGNAKLFLILVSQQLARRLAADHIPHLTVNTMHPGAVASNFSRQSNLGPLLNVALKLARPFFKTPAQGADTLIYLSSSPDVAGLTGQYFINRQPAPVAPYYDTLANEETVWDFCERVTHVQLL